MLAAVGRAAAFGVSTVTRAFLLRGLRRIARAIGRWLLRHLVERGVARLVGYLDGKIGDFKRRRARARTQRRKRWLTGRIRRWSAAMNWLVEHRTRITTTVAKAAEAAAASLPMRAKGEAY